MPRFSISDNSVMQSYKNRGKYNSKPRHISSSKHYIELKNL
jgi:hypothetical protein